MFEDKRGQLMGPTTALIATTLIVAIILIATLVAVALIGKPAKESPDAAKLQLQAMTSIQAYLQTPVNVTVDGKLQQMDMSDLIRLASTNPDYRDELEKETSSIFDKVYPGRYHVQALVQENSGALTSFFFIESSPGLGKLAIEMFSHPIQNFGPIFTSKSSDPSYGAAIKVDLPVNLIVRGFIYQP